MPISLYDTITQQPFEVEDNETAKELLSTNKAGFAVDQDVALFGPDGELYKVKGADANAYIFDKGYKLASQEDIYQKAKSETYSTPAQKAITATEGVVNSATLGFGPALTKAAIGILTPKDSDLDKRYAKAVEERREENPLSSLAGEVAGIFVDPLGAGALVTKGAKAVGKGVAVTGEIGAKLKAPKFITDIVLGKTGVKAVEFGIEGGTYAAGYETGRQLLDDKPLNPEAIASEFKHGFATGGAIGGAIGATGQAASRALQETKILGKKYLDKITGATEKEAGELFKDTPIMSLEKEIEPKIGRQQKSIKLTETPDGAFSYSDGTRQGIISKFEDGATGINLKDPQAVNELGKSLGIDKLAEKIKYNKKDESLAEFLAREIDSQIKENQVASYYPYMEPNHQVAYEKIQEMKQAFFNLKNVTEHDVDLIRAAYDNEKRLFGIYNPEYAEATAEQLNDLFKQDLSRARRKLSEFDYIVTAGEKGESVVNVFNENILPKSLKTKSITKGINPLSFESKELSKQLGITPAKMDKLGNARLNEISDFILSHYPQEGSILKQATTSLDHIMEGINTTKTKAIGELEETINHALNIGGVRQKLTNEDIAKYIETNILSNYTDRATGNPIAGTERAHNQIKGLADSFRNTNFEEKIGKYGKERVYTPLDVKQLRETRINLDKIAEFQTETEKPLVKAARDLRFWIEDQVIDRVGAMDKSLKERYVVAKKNYRNALDSEKVVSLATKKAAQKSNFSLLYSGISAAIGGGVGGAAGAITGGLLGGAIKNTMNEFSGTLSIFLTRDLAKNIDKYERNIENAAKAFFKPVEIGAELYLKTPSKDEFEIAKKDIARLAMELESREQYISKFIDHNEYLFSNFPKTSNAVLEKSLVAREFLVSKIPKNPYAGNPLKENKWQPAPSELSKYMRYREAVNNPAVILDQIKRGYVTPEAAEVLNVVYPETKKILAEKFISNLDKAKDIPFQKRVEIYKVFGVKLDNFTQPENFLMLQMKANGQAQQTEQGMKTPNVSKMRKKELTQGNETVK